MVLLTPRPEISQQRGFVHAGTVSAIADTAAGYAALSMMPADRAVPTTEFKIDLVAPAVGQRIVAEGRVVKSGRTLTLAQSEVFAESGGERRLVALLTATLMAIEGRDENCARKISSARWCRQSPGLRSMTRSSAKPSCMECWDDN
ncbi:PaaI family thioesterase [Bradyrhizobium sp. SZCCHNS3002]|uniref:PaaI family thioesterase n=1 Tax=unclassified Bradyrhizobium TaxID=2631580 RepID=UPI0028ECECD7|nr:PaaI family thioesterase [Bradyrhizobium sp. SZCCHNS3002]